MSSDSRFMFIWIKTIASPEKITSKVQKLNSTSHPYMHMKRCDATGFGPRHVFGSAQQIWTKVTESERILDKSFCNKPNPDFIPVGDQLTEKV